MNMQIQADWFFHSWGGKSAEPLSDRTEITHLWPTITCIAICYLRLTEL